MGKQRSGSVSLRVFVLSTLTITGIAIGVFEGVRRLGDVFVRSSLWYFPAVIAGLLFIWFFWPHITGVYKRLFREE